MSHAICDSCQDNYVWMGDSCVSVGLIIGLAVGIGVIVIAILIVILVMQSRKMKHVKSMPATDK
jgi:membrane protein implicated in regulation of membrane protease activity